MRYLNSSSILKSLNLSFFWRWLNFILSRSRSQAAIIIYCLNQIKNTLKYFTKNNDVGREHTLPSAETRVSHQLSFSCEAAALQLITNDEATINKINEELLRHNCDTANWRVHEGKSILVTADSQNECERCVREVFPIITWSYKEQFSEDHYITLLRQIKETCLLHKQVVIVDNSARVQIEYSDMYNSLISKRPQTTVIITIAEDCKTVTYEGVKTSVLGVAQFVAEYLAEEATLSILINLPIPIERYFRSYGQQRLLMLQNSFNKFCLQFKLLINNNSLGLEAKGKKKAIDVIASSLTVDEKNQKLKAHYFTYNDRGVSEYLLSDRGRKFLSDIEQEERVIVHSIKDTFNDRNNATAFTAHLNNFKVCAICCDLNSTYSDLTINISSSLMDERIKQIVDRRTGKKYYKKYVILLLLNTSYYNNLISHIIIT